LNDFAVDAIFSGVIISNKWLMPKTNNIYTLLAAYLSSTYKNH